jgi:hypothetical protein
MQNYVVSVTWINEYGIWWDNADRGEKTKFPGCGEGEGGDCLVATFYPQTPHGVSRDLTRSSLGKCQRPSVWDTVLCNINIPCTIRHLQFSLCLWLPSQNFVRTYFLLHIRHVPINIIFLVWSPEWYLVISKNNYSHHYDVVTGSLFLLTKPQTPPSTPYSDDLQLIFVLVTAKQDAKL